MPRRASVILLWLKGASEARALLSTVARRRLSRPSLGCHHRWCRAVHQWHHQAWCPTVGFRYEISFFLLNLWKLFFKMSKLKKLHGGSHTAQVERKTGHRCTRQAGRSQKRATCAASIQPNVHDCCLSSSRQAATVWSEAALIHAQAQPRLLIEAAPSG
jgi:hypothetical protein